MKIEGLEEAFEKEMNQFIDFMKKEGCSQEHIDVLNEVKNIGQIIAERFNSKILLALVHLYVFSKVTRDPMIMRLNVEQVDMAIEASGVKIIVENEKPIVYN